MGISAILVQLDFRTPLKDLFISVVSNTFLPYQFELGYVQEICPKRSILVVDPSFANDY